MLRACQKTKKCTVQGGPKKWGHYVWRLTSAYVFKTSELISMIFGTLQRRFILNTSVDFRFIKFRFQQTLKTFSRINLKKLKNKIDCGSVLKDEKKLEGVHDCFEHHHCNKRCACSDLICSDVRQTVTRREASANGHVISYRPMRFAAEQQIHHTDFQVIRWCSCSRFLITFGLSQEARKLKKVIFNRL